MPAVSLCWLLLDLTQKLKRAPNNLMRSLWRSPSEQDLTLGGCAVHKTGTPPCPRQGTTSHQAHTSRHASCSQSYHPQMVQTKSLHTSFLSLGDEARLMYCALQRKTWEQSTPYWHLHLPVTSLEFIINTCSERGLLYSNTWRGHRALQNWLLHDLHQNQLEGCLFFLRPGVEPQLFGDIR